ncbi:MAG TPA: ATP-binding protein [bacterium]|nr:ATP-binding protein [bacterium]
MNIRDLFSTDICVRANAEKIFSTGQMVAILLIIIPAVCFMLDVSVLDTNVFLIARLSAFIPSFFFLVYSLTFASRTSYGLNVSGVLVMHLGINTMNAVIIYKIYTDPYMSVKLGFFSIFIACMTFILQIIVGKGIRRWLPATMIIPAFFLTVWMLTAGLPGNDLTTLSTYHFFLFIAVIISIMEDRLERKDLRSHIIEAERNKLELRNKCRTEFISNISHELRTPLNGIIGLHELLKETELNDEQKEYLNYARQCGYHLLEMINDLLDVNSLEERKITLKLEKVKLVDLAHDILRNFASVCKKDIEFIFQSDLDENTAVLTDPKRLRQVISNLISNAEKFTESGSITLSLKLNESTPEMLDVLFSVTDTGIGIPSEKIPFIFDRFYQVDNGLSRKYGGTGLGLAICRMIVDIMGGKIRCESTEGTGSRFYFSLKFFID